MAVFLLQLSLLVAIVLRQILKRPGSCVVKAEAAPPYKVVGMLFSLEKWWVHFWYRTGYNVFLTLCNISFARSTPPRSTTSAGAFPHVSA